MIKTSTSRLRSIMSPACVRLITDERGATAIEYALIAASVGAFISATVFGVGSGLKANFYDKLAALF
ncbi:MAG TPA: Flp family type IVb pilin [Xanthobacteraceae bacterium]|nr:Flp family type IVb pilin [Xanthobacteraceae bacterium]